ncbi:hypothetical protein P692DRAFT_20834157 [Suillus brevipes Sb2]|nr:hypothetical protein P692DRAFT_20834157 [Suillus brevipes Sb2]
MVCVWDVFILSTVLTFGCILRTCILLREGYSALLVSYPLGIALISRARFPTAIPEGHYLPELTPAQRLAVIG